MEDGRPQKKGGKARKKAQKAQGILGWARCGGLSSIYGMSDGTFTPRAAVMWGAIPKEARERILANVFCVKCRTSVQITNFTGDERKGDVYLKGACAKCGHEVVRVVETSESDNSGN